MRDMYYFSLVWAFKNIIQVKVYVQKGAPSLEKMLTINVIVSSNLHFYPSDVRFEVKLLLWVTSMDDNMINDFVIEKWKWIVCIIKTFLFHDFYFVYDIVEEFNTLNIEILI